MTGDLSFIICTEHGDLESKSLLLAESIRNFGGKYKNSPIYSFQPRKGLSISDTTKKIFEKLNVVHCEIDLNKNYPDYPLANKPYTADYAERNIETEILVFCDSDQVVLQAPSALLLSSEYDVGINPVEVKNIGTDGERDENLEYWLKLYQIADVKTNSFVRTSVTNEKILSYWNSGLVAVRREKKIFNLWRELFDDVMKKELFPRTGRNFVEQSTLSTVIARLGIRVIQLPATYNYPLPYHDKLSKDKRAANLDELHTLHYHAFFKARDFRNPIYNLTNRLEKTTKLKWVVDKINQYGIFIPYSPLDWRYWYRLYKSRVSKQYQD